MYNTVFENAPFKCYLNTINKEINVKTNIRKRFRCDKINLYFREN